MSGSLDAEAVRSALGRLRKLDRRCAIFGASGHAYRLHPPLRESQVAAVERRHRMCLPADYRSFLIEIGNGGAGPAYGLFKLGEHDDGHDFCPWQKGFVGDLSKPFPHRAAWNLPESFWEREPDIDSMSEREADRAMAAWDRTVNERYWDSRLVNGAIPICHLGCAARQWLVVTGPESGHVWNDDRADNAGLSPVTTKTRRRLSFTDWYLNWLKACLAAASRRR